MVYTELAEVKLHLLESTVIELDVLALEMVLTRGSMKPEHIDWSKSDEDIIVGF